MRDSAVSPLLTAQYLIETSAPHSPIRTQEWWDQIILFFLGTLPRAIWNDKPFGFGFQYTVDNLTSSYINSGHSIAATFMGEHIYYLHQPIFVAGTILAIYMVVITYKILNHRRFLYGCGGYLVAIYIPTFYWGGLASFSQRFLFGLATAIIIASVMAIIGKFTPKITSTNKK